MQKQGLSQNLRFQKRWLLLMLGVSLAAHGLFLLLPGFSTPPYEVKREKILVGFQPRIATLPAVISSPQTEQHPRVREQTTSIKPLEKKSPPVPTKPKPETAIPVPAKTSVKTDNRPEQSLSENMISPPQQPEQASISQPPTELLLPESATETTAPATTPADRTEKTTQTALSPPATSLSNAAIEAPPTYLDNPRPVYPPLARQRGWQGDVLVRVSVDQHGKVLKTTLQQSSGHRILDRSALKQIRTWKFRPALRGEEKVAGEVTVPIHFRLRQS